jgi:hypothetical protein
MLAMIRASALCLASWIAVALCLLPRPVSGQGAVGFTQQRPFVIGFIPVVGRNGAVGGVSIDAAGVVSRSDADLTGKLRDARMRALTPLSGELLISSSCAVSRSAA